MREKLWGCLLGHTIPFSWEILVSVYVGLPPLPSWSFCLSLCSLFRPNVPDVLSPGFLKKSSPLLLPRGPSHDISVLSSTACCFLSLGQELTCCLLRFSGMSSLSRHCWYHLSGLGPCEFGSVVPQTTWQGFRKEVEILVCT